MSEVKLERQQSALEQAKSDAAMDKPMLTPDQYMVELNRCLRLHDGYRKCMAFVPNPEGATGSLMSGYAVAGPFAAMAIYAQVAHEVAGRFGQNSDGTGI